MAVAVLVVDDVPELRTLLRVALGADGRFDVVGVCATAQEAIEAAEREQPDVIVLDVDLPDRDGLSAIPDLRAVAPNTSILVYTGSLPPGATGSPRRAGADGTVAKTDGLDALVNAVAQVAGLGGGEDVAAP